MAFNFYKDAPPLKPIMRVPEHLRSFWSLDNEDFNYSDSHIWKWSCKHCRYAWEATMKIMSKRKDPCRICSASTSKNERNMYYILMELKDEKVITNIEHQVYNQDAGFSDFKVTTTGGHTFMLEADGQQHFFPPYETTLFPYSLAYNKAQDRKRNTWWRKNKIPFLRISSSAACWKEEIKEFINRVEVSGEPCYDFIGVEYVSESQFELAL